MNYCHMRKFYARSFILDDVCAFRTHANPCLHSYIVCMCVCVYALEHVFLLLDVYFMYKTIR